MEGNASHQRTGRELGKDPIRSILKNPCEGIAGIQGTRTEASIFMELEYAPEPIVKIGLALPGGIFGDSIYLERSAIQHVVAPILTKIAKMLREFGVGTSYSMLRLSETESEIIVCGTNSRSTADRIGFLSGLHASVGRAREELKLISQLAQMPAEKFSHAWFAKAIHPDQSYLNALRAVLDLSRVLTRCGAILIVDGQPLALPKCGMLQTTKHGGKISDVVGELAGLDSDPGIVVVKTNEGAKTIALRAIGKGFVDQLNQEFRLRDTVRVSFEPVIDMLRPFEALPSKGRLLAIAAA